VDTLLDPEWGFSYAAEHTCFNRATGYPHPLYTFFEDVCHFDGTILSLQTQSFSRRTMRKLPSKGLDSGKQWSDGMKLLMLELLSQVRGNYINSRIFQLILFRISLG